MVFQPKKIGRRRGKQMKALEGLVVIDMSRRYPGAFPAMLLGDFGAKVIKVDPPGSSFPYPDIDTTTEHFAAFYALDRNKQSIILNVKTDSGREAFQKLVKKADIIIEGFRPGVMERMGLGYDVLRGLNPRLIYCALTGYGQTGPYRDVPGHDMNYVALGAALNMIGPKDGAPCFPSNYLADMAGAGLNGAVGILLALAARERTGKGQLVDISFMDGVISLLTMEASHYFATGKVPSRGETALTGSAPLAQVLKCKDGKYFTVACFEPVFWQHLCKVIGREDLVPYAFPEDDKKKEWAIAELGKVFLSRTRDEWWELLKDKDTCVAPIYNLEETSRDPHVTSRQMVVEMEHAKFGKVRQIGTPIKLSDTPAGIERLGVQIGADTDTILNWVGYTTDEIRELRRQGGAS